jgi:gamma-glutamylcyclotransferase (GGCT)/AIG2-like uncharacterized protein YtfP
MWPVNECCFAYGSLICADIMSAVTGQVLHGEPARLDGHVRHPVRGEDYPGVVAQPGGRVDGILYSGLDGAALARLDAFEGDMYERRQVTVNLVGGGQRAAWCYIVAAASEHRLLPGDWDYDAFLAEGKARFLARYVGFAAIAASR